MNPEMSGSPFKQKRKCEIDSNDEYQIKSKSACMDGLPKPTEQQAQRRKKSLPFYFMARIGTVDRNIPKAKTDKQDYCYFKLDNGLQVLVVSDSECEMAHVHLLVKCGSFNDPESVPGLAHCLEHMILLTDMKIHPYINHLDYFLHKYSGYANGYTKNENSGFTFSVPSPYLFLAMTYFSDAIVHAKFDEIRIRKEVNNINSEFECNFKDEPKTQLWAALVRDNPYHPFGRDGCGNKETFQESVDVKALMEKLYKDHYISSNMCLVVIGKEPINMLTKMVVNSAFGHMPKQTPTTPVIRDHVIKQTKRAAFINYDFDASDTLRIQWKIDSYSWTYPVKYINTFIGHEGPNGLLGKLKRRGWANDIWAGFNDLCTGSTIYSVNVDLTWKGLKFYEDVVGMVYNYIYFVKENKAQENLETMCKNMARREFVYNQNGEDYAAFLCRRLWDVCYHDFKLKYILKKYATPEEGKNMDRFLNQLVPGNCRIVVSGYDICAELDDKIKEKLKFSSKTKYHPSYDICNIDKETIKKWEKRAIKSGFDVPHVTKYYPVSTKHKIAVPEQEERISSEPKLIHKTKQCTVWYKQDSRVLHPFASFRLCGTPASPDKEHLTMFIAMWKHRLQHLLYQAKFGDLKITISTKDNMFTVQVEGYPEYLKKCVSSIAFEMKKMIRMTNEATYDQCQESKLGEVKKNYEPYRSWLLEMLPNVQRLFLVCGHISKEEALDLCDEVRISFCDKKEEKEKEKEKEKEEETEEEPPYRYRRKSKSVNSKSIFAEFDCSAACDEFGVAIVDLFCHVFYWDCYIFLRSLCTLAYDLDIKEDIIIDKQKRISNMKISLEAEGCHDRVQIEIEYFLIFIIKTRLEQLSEYTLAKHKAALEMKSKRNPINQREAHKNYWTSLLKSTSGAKDGKYFKDLATEKKNYSTKLGKIKLSDLKYFYYQYIHPAGDRVKYTINGHFDTADTSVYLSAHVLNNNDLSEILSAFQDFHDEVLHGTDDDYKTMHKFKFMRSPSPKKTVLSKPYFNDGLGLLGHKSLGKKP